MNNFIVRLFVIISVKKNDHLSEVEDLFEDNIAT